MIDIVNAFKREYQEAVLITGQLIKRYADLDSYARMDMITAYKRKNTLSRLYSWLLATMQIIFRLMVRYKKDFDLFLVTNPPTGVFLPLFFKRKFSLLIFDTYPDVLITHRILKENSIISKWWRRVNRKVFNKASNIFTISEGMADCLTQYMDRSKIRVIPNWSNTSFLKPITHEENPFIIAHSMERKFIVLYSGNMGITHDIESIVELAETMKDERDVLFLFIGEGVKKAKIESLVTNMKLSNCKFLPYQKATMLPLSLNCAHIGIVTLNRESSLLSVPSKVYSLMAVGAVILGIGNSHSELGHIVKSYQIGDVFDKESIREMRTFILNMKNNTEQYQLFSSNSRKASFDFTQENALLYVKNYK